MCLGLDDPRWVGSMCDSLWHIVTMCVKHIQTPASHETVYLENSEQAAAPINGHREVQSKALLPHLPALWCSSHLSNIFPFVEAMSPWCQLCLLDSPCGFRWFHFASQQAIDKVPSLEFGVQTSGLVPAKYASCLCIFTYNYYSVCIIIIYIYRLILISCYI